MELKNMKLTRVESQEVVLTAKMEKPEYPWGLRLDLNNETLKKLGFPLPSVGQTLVLHARVDVTSASMTEEAGGEKRLSASLQITDMGLEPETKSPETVDILYKKEG